MEKKLRPSGQTRLKDLSASKQIDAIISEHPDWKGKMLSQLRALIKIADPRVVEEVKWKKPINPGGAKGAHSRASETEQVEIEQTINFSGVLGELSISSELFDLDRADLREEFFESMSFPVREYDFRIPFRTERYQAHQ